MNRIFESIKPFGEHAVLIEFERKIDENLLDKILYYKNKIEQFYVEVKVEVINTYNSILVNYLHSIENIDSELLRLKKYISGLNIGGKKEFFTYRLPVCYDSEFGLDLELIAKKNKCTLNEIIELHTAPEYRVYFLGFLPGFLYLGGLEEKLYIPRKNSPRMQVKKGAVGIGEKQTGVYPKASPGGWQIIGNCPVPIFDKNRTPPCEISAGDKVKFYSVSKKDYDEISKAVTVGTFQVKKEKHES